MLRGYRFLIAAACGLVLFVALGTGAFFGALYAPHNGDQAKESTYHSAKAEEANPSQIDRDRAGLPYLAESIASGPDPKDTDDREKRDLAAQEASALWAFWLLVISLAGTIITMIGTGFLLWQIILTREAVRDTGEATEAMREANRIISRSQRPWVSVSVVPKLLCKTGNTLRVEYDIECRNLGQLPATNYQLQRKLTWHHNTSALPDDPFRQFRPIDEPTRKIILPGDTETFQDWKYQAFNQLPWEEDNPDDYVVPILLVTVFYKSEGTEDQWLRTDKGYFLARKVKDSRSSAAYRRDFDDLLAADKLVMEPLTAATLAD